MFFTPDGNDAITEPTQITGPLEVWQEKPIKQIQCQPQTTTHNNRRSRTDDNNKDVTKKNWKLPTN